MKKLASAVAVLATWIFVLLPTLVWAGDQNRTDRQFGVSMSYYPERPIPSDPKIFFGDIVSGKTNASYEQYIEAFHSAGFNLPIPEGVPSGDSKQILLDFLLQLEAKRMAVPLPARLGRITADYSAITGRGEGGVHGDIDLGFVRALEVGEVVLFTKDGRPAIGGDCGNVVVETFATAEAAGVALVGQVKPKGLILGDWQPVSKDAVAAAVAVPAPVSKGKIENRGWTTRHTVLTAIFLALVAGYAVYAATQEDEVHIHHRTQCP